VNDITGIELSKLAVALAASEPPNTREATSSPQSNRAADLPVVLATFVPPHLIEALTSLIVNGFIGPFR
jgi:hypothetical protein